jgi:hypothetical protein
VEHADGAAHDRHRHADAGALPDGAVAQHRAGVEVLAVGEHLGLGPEGGLALVGRVDRAAGRLRAFRCGDDDPLEVGVAVVRDQELGGRVRQDAA